MILATREQGTISADFKKEKNILLEAFLRGCFCCYNIYHFLVLFLLINSFLFLSAPLSASFLSVLLSLEQH